MLRNSVLLLGLALCINVFGATVEDVWLELDGSASPRDLGLGASATWGRSLWPCLASDPDGHLLLAWHDNYSGNFEIFVRRWDGSEWVEMGEGSSTGGGISNNSGESYGPQMAISPELGLVIAWVDETAGNKEIYVRRWNGGNWVELGEGSASGGGISLTDTDSVWLSLGLNHNGYPIIAWEERAFDGKWVIFLKYWNGSAWAEWDYSATWAGISHFPGPSREPDLAVGSDGFPTVSWSNIGGLHIRRWDGQDWLEIGEGSATGEGIGTGRYSQVILDSNDRPIVASHVGTEITVRTWTGEEWIPLIPENHGSESAIEGRLGDLVMSAEGRPTLAYIANVEGIYNLHIKEWTGINWAEVSHGSATGGGISNTPGESNWPYIIVGNDGLPIVAWSDRTPSYPNDYANQIYVRRWNGDRFPPLGENAWPPMGRGMEIQGGLSNSPPQPVFPLIDTDSSGNPVAFWFEGGSSGPIVGRRWVGDGWITIPTYTNTGVKTSRSHPDMILDSNDYPMTLWGESFGTHRIEGISWTGEAWNVLDLANVSMDEPRFFDLARRPSGQISVVCGRYDRREVPNERFRIFDYNGSTWDLVGTFPRLDNVHDFENPALVFDQYDRPIIAWLHDGIRIHRLIDGAWVEFGGGDSLGISGTRANDPRIAIDENDNPIVSWRNRTGQHDQVSIMRWDGSAWQDIGEGSSSEEGVSRSSSDTSHHQLMMGPDGNPVLAWIEQPTESSPVSSRIVAVRWDGTSWTSVGPDLPTNWGGTHHGGFDIALDHLGNPFITWIAAKRDVFLVGATLWNSLAGSANGDARIDSADVVALTNHLNDAPPITHPAAITNADLNTDGELTQDDLDLLLEMLLGD